MSKTEITAKSYTLRTENNQWLGQVVLTSDGMFASVTDYGNLSYTWRNTGDGDFRKFLIGLNCEYFGDKLFNGMSYIAHTKNIDKACQRFAQKILPPLQQMLKKEIESESSTCQICSRIIEEEAHHCEITDCPHKELIP